MLLDENIKAISHGVLKQMDLDLIQCEMFAEGGSELIKGLDVSFLSHLYTVNIWLIFYERVLLHAAKPFPLDHHTSLE